MASLEAKLDKIRSPNLQNQKQVAVVLSAVEDILKDQNTPQTPTAYFAALLSLLQQSISPTTITNTDLATSTVYLLDTITPFTPGPLLRSRFPQILTHLVPALTHHDASAALLRSSIGCLEALLVAQDGAAWAVPQREIGPRRALAGLLNLALDERPKVRRRAQEAVTGVLRSQPMSPCLDHPAADMCAAVTLGSVGELLERRGQGQGQAGKRKGAAAAEHDPRLIHALQLVKAVCVAGGWPSKRVEALCEVLLGIAKSSNEFLMMAAFGVFEEVFSSLAEPPASAKLPGVLSAISELRPSQTDSQLLPPWLTVVARGHEVYALVDADAAFAALPALFSLVSTFLESPAYTIRASASQCLVSLVASVIPDSALLDITRSTEAIFAAVARTTTDLLSVRYQSAWKEVFDVLSALLDKLRWRATPLLNDAVKLIGDLRGNEGFQGKKEADDILGRAVRAMGPDVVLGILPLNLAAPKPGAPGRAWMLPVLRLWVRNAPLGHFRAFFVPLSESFFQKVVDAGDGEKTVEVKIFETLVGQIWSLFPGYCDLPSDLVEAFDQPFAELLANVLYQKVEMRADICKGLQYLVDSNKAVVELELGEDGEEDLVLQHRVTKEQARANIAHLAGFSGNLLAVLFNVYSTTLPQYRGFILKCLNSFLSITPHKELMETFTKVTTMLESTLAESAEKPSEKSKDKSKTDRMPPMAHTLMDLVIAITPYLPSASHHSLFLIFAATVNKSTDPQLQKKAYKVIPRLAETPEGRSALSDKSEALQKFLIDAADKATPPARRDRLGALSQLVEFLPQSDLHFIPSILSEVVISAKEVNEKARTAAFDLLVLMGEKMAAGGKVVNSKVAHMPPDAPDVDASLDEYVTMVSAGLAGSTPHMISASITALTRILYQFKEAIRRDLVEEMVTTLDLFLTSKNREVVRSVLGFVKVCVISLPKEMMLPRFETLVPNLMVWSHEHKAHFKAKVKHIVERMIRRFGYEAVERYVPEEDKKLVVNIRKTRERRKRQKDAAATEGGDEDEEEVKVSKKRQSKFASEFEEAIYGSDSDASDGSGASEAEPARPKKGRKRSGPETFIVEDADEPLDLLDHKSLANISTTRPQRTRIGDVKKNKTNALKPKTNADGKLVLGADDDKNYVQDNGGDGDVDMAAAGAGGDGVSAYVDAIAGKDAFRRGQRNRVKFSNKRSKGRDAEGDEDMGDDDQTDGATSSAGGGYSSGGKRAKGGRGAAGGKGVKEGRVGKGHGQRRGRGK